MPLDLESPEEAKFAADKYAAFVEASLRKELKDAHELGRLLLRFVERITPDPGVYILFCQGEVVYVGESECVASRLSGHRAKEYDEVRMLATFKGSRFDLERKLIAFFRPPLNQAPGRRKITNATGPLSVSGDETGS